MVSSKQTKLDAQQLAYVLQVDKYLMKQIGEKCMRRCVLTYEVELLNALEQNCVDRCTSKFDEMVTHIASTNPMMQML
jgi:hypothetical protein